MRATIHFDRREISDAFLLLEILNIRRAGPGMELAAHASPSDGRFDVVTATAAQRQRLVAIFDARLTQHDPPRGLTTRRSRHVKLHVNSACDIRIDDGTLKIEADTTIDITIKPGALEFVLPG